MHKKIDENKFGQESYVITQLSDVANLPKRGRQVEVLLFYMKQMGT